MKVSLLFMLILSSGKPYILVNSIQFMILKFPGHFSEAGKCTKPKVSTSQANVHCPTVKYFKLVK